MAAGAYPAAPVEPRVVGLDEDFWVNRYMEAYQQSGQLKTDDADWIAFAENVGKLRSWGVRVLDDVHPGDGQEPAFPWQQALDALRA